MLNLVAQYALEMHLIMLSISPVEKTENLIIVWLYI